MLRLYEGKIPKVATVYNIELGRGGDEVCSVNVHRLSNLGGMGLILGLCPRLYLSCKYLCVSL